MGLQVLAFLLAKVLELKMRAENPDLSIAHAFDRLSQLRRMPVRHRGEGAKSGDVRGLDRLDPGSCAG